MDILPRLNKPSIQNFIIMVLIRFLSFWFLVLPNTNILTIVKLPSQSGIYCRYYMRCVALIIYSGSRYTYHLSLILIIIRNDWKSIISISFLRPWKLNVLSNRILSHLDILFFRRQWWCQCPPWTGETGPSLPGGKWSTNCAPVFLKDSWRFSKLARELN